jgi:hypothetical protein
MPANNARQYHTQQTHYLQRTVAYNTPGISGGVLMGTIPAGALILGTYVRVETGFNAATTNVLTVGTLGDPGLDNIVTAGDVTEGSAGSVRIVGPLNRMAADTDVMVSYTQSGAAATAGLAHVVLEYVTNN